MSERQDEQWHVQIEHHRLLLHVMEHEHRRVRRTEEQQALGFRMRVDRVLSGVVVMTEEGAQPCGVRKGRWLGWTEAEGGECALPFSPLWHWQELGLLLHLQETNVGRVGRVERGGGREEWRGRKDRVNKGDRSRDDGALWWDTVAHVEGGE
jgi:hypothetical protein